MNAKSDDKRRQIATVAAELFAERGFDATSIDDIVQRVGGSKSTIYSYFGSKDGLLNHVLDVDLSGWIGPMSDALLNGDDLHAGFTSFGIAYLTRMLGTHAIGHLRIGIALSTTSDVGRAYYRSVLRPAWNMIADRIERLMDQDRLVRADPWLAAMHWKGLTECGLGERRLLGDLDRPDADDIARAANSAASAFLRIYAPQTNPARRGVKDTAMP